MHTIHSILVAGAVFGAFMLSGMESVAGDTLQGGGAGVSAPHGNDKSESNVVQDNTAICLKLLYHNPSRGLPAISCRAPQHPAHGETVGSRGGAA